MSEEAVRVVQPEIQRIGVTQVVGPPGPPGDETLVSQLVTEHLETAVPVFLSSHVNDSTPHPAYDDLPSLTLLFENGLL